MSTGSQKASKRATEFDARTQAQKFEEAARESGADENEAAFKDKLREIARRKPKDGVAEPEPKRPARKPRTG